MFFLWVMIRMAATIIEKVVSTGFVLPRTSVKINGKAMPPSIDDNDTILVEKRTTKKTTSDNEHAAGTIQTTMPKIVATPLPPLNPAKTGKMWPISDATPRPS